MTTKTNYHGAYIHPDAKIGRNVEIGPFSYIAGNVEIGDGCRIGPNATILDYVRIGENCKIFPGAVVGAEPQDLKFHGEESHVIIGNNTTIRECVTINRGTAASERYATVVGDNCLIMSYVHIAHDCRIGNNCIFSSYVGMAGETDVDDWAIVGGGTLIHQFSHIGAHVMIGGGTGVVKDVPPYILAARNPINFEGINIVGLRRRGFTHDEIDEIREIYRVIYDSGMNISDAVSRVKSAFPDTEAKMVILDFISNSKRGIVKKGASSSIDD